MHIDRDLVNRSIVGNWVDYDLIVSEMERLHIPECKRANPTRSRDFESIAQELRDFEGCVDEPFEKARRLALVVDGFSSLAHIHTEMHNFQEQTSLRYQKDTFMKVLAAYCKDNNICVGVGLDRNGNSTLEIDIPYVGHVGWHFGRKIDVYDYIRRMGVGEYRYDVEPKIGKNGLEYTNASLLKGDLNPEKEMNQTDRNLARYGSRVPPRKTYEF